MDLSLSFHKVSKVPEVIHISAVVVSIGGVNDSHVYDSKLKAQEDLKHKGMEQPVAELQPPKRGDRTGEDIHCGAREKLVHLDTDLHLCSSPAV